MCDGAVSHPHRPHSVRCRHMRMDCTWTQQQSNHIMCCGHHYDTALEAQQSRASTIPRGARMVGIIVCATGRTFGALHNASSVNVEVYANRPSKGIDHRAVEYSLGMKNTPVVAVLAQIRTFEGSDTIVLRRLPAQSSGYVKVTPLGARCMAT